MKSHAEIDTVPRTARQQLARLAVGVAIAVTLGAGLAGQAALAQEATPSPVTCAVQPRPATFIVDLQAQPEPADAVEPLTALPDGSDDVDEATRAATTAVVEELIACVNQGDLLRAFALYDDAYLRRLIDPEGLMSESIAVELGKTFATPEARDATKATVLERVILIRRLDDGSVAVVFETRGGVDRDQDELQIDLFILREIGGQWRIVDGLADLDPDSISAS
jgi:hypothetical protein